MKQDITNRDMTKAPKAVQAGLRRAAREGRTIYISPTYYGLVTSATQPVTARYYQAEPDGTVYIVGGSATFSEVVA